MNTSESDHSIEREEVLVERTVSMCSENQSEAFFSAEEELSAGLIGAGVTNLPSSRSSSLRHSIGIYRQDSNGQPNTGPKYVYLYSHYIRDTIVV